jgi:hypothetical protein
MGAHLPNVDAVAERACHGAFGYDHEDDGGCFQNGFDWDLDMLIRRQPATPSPAGANP